MAGHWAVDDLPHRCHTPSEEEMRSHNKGERWICDECKQVWEIVSVDGGMREPDVHYKYMRKVHR